MLFPTSIIFNSQKEFKAKSLVLILSALVSKVVCDETLSDYFVSISTVTFVSSWNFTEYQTVTPSSCYPAVTSFSVSGDSLEHTVFNTCAPDWNESYFEITETVQDTKTASNAKVLQIPPILIVKFLSYLIPNVIATPICYTLKQYRFGHKKAVQDSYFEF
ncbi:hypothetical protein CANARDRAFT_20869 [[Candida] arabinofermentans NRRL YB-2248]|uniref:Uncharacterized protein n=1 Tax=[Candida] arabinofermentans NRRL YB-2248 TaxID=983967 RepID=A0A1E4T8T6_9ASCO|nr:hypothetical protein CANARDRAFT_20869 [[Candida] arabinofermentans NRRL YB-2248]